MERILVESSNIKSVGWENKTLQVEFTSGSLYEYENVPQVIWEAFQQAPSKGKFFYNYIKGIYPFKKVERIQE